MTTYTYRKYIPAFMSGFDRPEGNFTTQEELLNVPFIKGWIDDPKIDYLAITSDYEYLMAVTKSKHWYVIASLSKGSYQVLNLPTLTDQVYRQLEKERSELDPMVEIKLYHGFKGDKEFVRFTLYDEVSNKDMYIDLLPEKVYNLINKLEELYKRITKQEEK